MKSTGLRSCSRSLFAVLLALLLAATAFAQTKPKILDSGATGPVSIICIGNSFFYRNNGINGHVTQFVNAGEPGRPLRSTMVTISGSGFDWYDVESYFQPNALGKAYAAMFKKSPVGSSYTAGFDPAIAKQLQQVAWDTVQSYYGAGN